MTDAATYRALASRVETEAPSRELQEAVMRVFGWIGPHRITHRWLAPAATHTVARTKLLNPLTSADAALALMPEGWIIDNMQGPAAHKWFCRGGKHSVGWMEESVATAFPRAVTALALRCRAADIEQEARDDGE